MEEQTQIYDSNRWNIMKAHVFPVLYFTSKAVERYRMFDACRLALLLSVYNQQRPE